MATKDEIRKLAELDLFTFAQLVNPNRVYGEIHKEVCQWLTKKDASPNQLVLLPRGHMKSHLIAVWCAWWITKHPDTTILYISSTSGLAEAQLYAIKNIITSKTYRRYWPEMVHPEEGKRARWSATEIIVDHPIREAEGVRDATISTAGLTTSTTGRHADIIVADDVVEPQNAYTEEGRRKVAAAMSQMASIKNTGGMTKAVGTRYHPRDQYYTWMETKMKEYDADGEIIDERPVWEVMERVVEEDGDFLWPREARSDGKSFGFDLRELARIEAEYTDKTQFFSQYYNNPNDPSSDRINRDRFQYYEPKFLRQFEGTWFFKEQPMNVYASIDFAFSLNKRADYTAIVVIGIVPDGNIYILDIDRFKADKISKYFDKIVELHSKWGFKKLRAEVTVAQQIIVRDIKDMITKNGLRLTVDEFRPNKTEGSKEERIAAALEHRYDNQSIWHFRGGYTSVLEEELVLNKPPHDDIKDALASAVDMAVAPRAKRAMKKRNENVVYHSRFGGVRF